MADQLTYQKLFKMLDDEKRKGTTATELQGLVSRIKQPMPKSNIMNRVEDALYKKGIGNGSPQTQILQDKADARAKLIQFIQQPNNIKSFQAMPNEQKVGILNMMSDSESWGFKSINE